jgi:hypothetical protein
VSRTAIKKMTRHDSGRAFHILVNPGASEMYGVTLEETYVENGETSSSPVFTSSDTQTTRVIDAVVSAVRNSGHQASVLAFSRKAPIKLDEPSGVRLALILVATQPLTKHDRIRNLIAGINAMSIEESYYWYAKCFGAESSNARKALRTLIVGDVRRWVQS